MMRILSVVRCAAALLVLSAAPAASQGHPVAGVLRVEQLRFAAMMQGDTASLRGFLADELVYTHSNAMVETKALHLAAIATGKTVYQSIAPDSMGFHIYGDVAVGSGIVKSRGTLNGTPFDVTLRVSTVHLMRDGRWQLALWQSTRIP
jgi:hypothetical protein